MKKDLEDAIIVKQLSLEVIVIINISNKYRENLEAMGFIKKNKEYVNSIEIEDQNKRAKLIQQLINIGALFQYGREWSPSEIVEYYRDDLGLIIGNFNEITWKNTNEYEVIVR